MQPHMQPHMHACVTSVLVGLLCVAVAASAAADRKYSLGPHLLTELAAENHKSGQRNSQKPVKALDLATAAHASAPSHPPSERLADSEHTPHQIFAGTHQSHDESRAMQRKKNVLAVVGVMTAFSSGDGRYDYAKRRQYLRQTWFPATETDMRNLEREQGLVVRFVVGHGSDHKQEAAIKAEEENYGSFIRLALMESYRGLTNKTHLFWKAVAAKFRAEYVFKVDDDKYVRLDRVPYAIQQWRERKANYIGCFKFRHMMRDRTNKWFDPQHKLVVQDQPIDGYLYAEGPLYVLSGFVVEALAHMHLPLRDFAGQEDASTGIIMKAYDVKHFDDPRLCEVQTCSASTIALDMAANKFVPSNCAVEEMDDLSCFLKTHSDPNCQLPTLDTHGELPMVPSRYDMDTDQAWLDDGTVMVT